MEKVDAIREIKTLVTKLNEWTRLYDLGQPAITDAEWDKKYFELVALEKEYPSLISPSSPTQKITYEVRNELKKVEHNHPMLSLDKTKDWDEFIQHFTIGKDVIGMLKLDGLTCSLEYIDGKLVKAETRGDGRIGEDVFHNAVTIKNIPKKIDYKEHLVIDGEVICTYQDFEPFSQNFANPRNFAAGSIRLLDAEECSKRNLSFIVWNVVEGLDECEYLLDKFNKLNSLNFTVTPWTSSFDYDAKEFLLDQAKVLGYPIDGLVGRYNDIKYGESLGATEHHSNAAYAFKFADEEFETTLRSIDYDVSRQGQLTPVAIFDEVDDGISKITRASLHNISVLKDLLGKPYLGQKLYVFKANQIIPQIRGAEKQDLAENFIEFPNICPVCGGAVSIHISDAGIENLYCDNPLCERKLAQRIEFFGGKKCLDIKGLSLKTIEKLIDWGWLNSIKDLYALKEHRAEWVRKPGFGIASVDKILSAIEESKKAPLYRFICACMIPEIGTKASKDLAKRFDSWDNFRKATYDDLISIDGFGDISARNILTFDYAEMDKIASNFMKNIENPETTKNSTVQSTTALLEGKTFVITGRLQLIRNRGKLINIVEGYGGKVVSSISKNTQYLINNDINSTSSKNKKAKDLGIPIISEKEFFDMIGGFDERFNK